MSNDSPSDGVDQRLGANPRALVNTSTIVIEGDVIPRRIRRPQDLMRLASAVALAVLILAGAYFASSTTAGISSDLTEASNRFPPILFVIIGFVSFMGVFILPLAAAIEMLIRKRVRLIIESFGAMVVAIVLAFVISWWIEIIDSPQLISALTGQPQNGIGDPISWVTSGTVAFITVARLIDRSRWATASVVLVLAVILANLVAGGITVAALALSVLIGWAIGLIVRYFFGTPTTRPSGIEVATALEKFGFLITILRATREVSGGRRYSATTNSGKRLELMVFDRDLEGAGIAKSIWRALRVREAGGSSGFTMRSRLEHAALQSYASNAAGAPVPTLEAVSSVGPDAALLAYSRIDGRSFAEIGSDLTDDNLESTWEALRILHDAKITHRDLQADNILLDANDKVWLMDPSDGFVASGDVAERLDLAELLCTLSLLATPSRAVAAGRKILGNERLSRALPVLQPVALTPPTRRAIRHQKDVLKELREELQDITPEGEVEQVEFRRLKLSTIFTIVAGTVAAYILLIQLSQIDLGSLLTEVNWVWAFFALLLSGITYFGATMSVQGFVPEKLNFWRTTQAQLASDFATLVSPPTLGAVAINMRYMQRSGIHPANAAASIGVAQVMAFFGHIFLMFVFAIIAGRQMEFDIAPPAWTIWVGAAFVALIIFLFILPLSRTWATKRIQPIFVQLGPRLLRLAQSPKKLAEGIAGIFILNLGYILCFIVCVRAFGGGGEWAAIAIVYLAGATLGQAAPTPGGLGAVEVALTTGLVAAGVDGGAALFAVLLFRLITFWLPTIPGWFCLQSLQKQNLL